MPGIGGAERDTKDLNILLDEAKNLNKEIQEEIDKLIKSIKRRMEEKPKFDIY